MTAAMLIVLVGLGTWQVRRLFWKEALLAAVDRAEASAPLPLPPGPFSPGLSSPGLSSPAPFAKISVTGTFLPEKTALYGAEVRTIASGPILGARLIVPLRRDTGGVILVDRGWVPFSRAEPIDHPAEPVTVTGYTRFGDQPGWFSARDDVVERKFYTLEVGKIAAAVGQPDALPFVLVVLAKESGPRERGTAPANPSAARWPDPARHLPRPPNSHLSYALTWYGLAVALLAIFIVWARKGRRA